MEKSLIKKVKNMNFEKLGNDVDNPKVTVGTLDFAKSDVFYTLSILLRKLKKEQHEIYQSFKEKVSNSLLKEIKKDHFVEHQEKIERLLDQFESITEESKFVSLHLSFLIEKLRITPTELWENKKIAFPTSEFMPSSFGLFFLQVSALIDLLGRDLALKFFREWIDTFNEEVNSINQKDIFTDLEHFRKDQGKWLPNNPYGRIQILSDGKNGQFIKICQTCEKYNSMVQTKYGQDKEILYTIMCYMHKPLAKVWNEHFRLEIENSLALGDKFCAYIYYDLRKETGQNLLSKEHIAEIWESKK